MEHIRTVFAVLTGRRKIYYGWWLAIGCVVSMAFASGVSFWSFGLYVEPLEEEFGWSRAQVSFGFSSALMVSGLFGPLIGRWVDRSGPRTSIIIGAILTALSYLLIATTSTLWQWYLFQVINAIFRQMMFIIPFQALISRWFDKKRGIALAMLGSGFSLGGFAVVPLMNLTIDLVQWQGSFIVAGIATAVIVLPIALFLLRNHPSEIGENVDGVHYADGETRPQTPAHGLTLGEAVRTPLFWSLAAGLMLFFYGMFGWLVHQVPFYESVGISRQAAANIVAAGAFLSIIARLSFGLVADRFPRFEVVAMFLAGTLFCSMLVLFLNTSWPAIGVFVMLWTIGAGAGPMMEALLLTRSFGLKHFGSIFGLIMVTTTLGQIISPTIAGAIFDATGSYDWALIIFMGTFASAFFFFTIAYRLPRPMDTFPGPDAAGTDQPGAATRGAPGQ